MISPWATFFWLALTFVFLSYLNRWLSIHIHSLGHLLFKSARTADWLYFFIFLPGIFLHELSHYVTAVLLAVDVGRFSLWPKPQKGGGLVLGSVTVRGAGPLRHSIIGAAPLFWGSAAVVLIGQLLHFDRLGDALLAGEMTAIFQQANDSLATPDFWLWLYLLFAVANAMLPSPADRIYWTPLLLFFGVIAVIAVGFNLVPQLSPPLEAALLRFITFMASAFTIAVIVDLFVMAALFFLEMMVSLFTGRKVQYQ